MTSQLKRAGIVLITPFIADGQIDTKALTNIVNYMIGGGAEFVVILGTTSKAPTLTREEKKIVRNTVIEANRGRLPLVLGIDGNNTQNVIDEVKTTGLTHLVTVLSATPYYNKPSQSGLYTHFAAVTTETPLPIILYNIPGHTGASLTAETIPRLANDFENIVAVKGTSGDLQLDMNIFKDTPANFTFLSGDDATTLPSVYMRDSGAISVIGIAYPGEFSGMVRLGLQGKIVEASKLHYTLMPKIAAVFKGGDPAGIKAVLIAKGLCQPCIHLPLIEASEALKEEIKRIEV